MMAKKVYIGTIEGIFGYGLSVVSETEEQCYMALFKAYCEWKDGRDWNDDYEQDYDIEQDKEIRKLYQPAIFHNKRLTRKERIFLRAFENWSGKIDEVEFDKVYYDNFNC